MRALRLKDQNGIDMALFGFRRISGGGGAVGVGAIEFTRHLLGFAAAYGLVLLTPGPNMMLVFDAACAGSRIGLHAAFGAASGATALALLAMTLGAFAAPASVITAAASQIAFGGMVIVLGARAMRRSAAAGPVPSPAGRGRNHFQIAFLTAFANPVTGLFFLAAAGGLGSACLLQRATLCGVVFGTAALWFVAVTLFAAFFLQAFRSGRAEGQAGRWGRRAAGLALIAYGLMLVQKAMAAG